MTVQLITHEKLLERRDKLKAKGIDKFLAYKAKRYGLFRVQNFLNGGAAPDTEHMEVSKNLEETTRELGGAKAFAIEWDIDPLTGDVIRRDKSVWKAHEDFMKKVATPLVAESA